MLRLLRSTSLYLKYLLADTTKHKARVHQLYFIGAFLQEKLKNRVFVKLDIIYTDNFPEYAKVLWKSLEIIKVHVWHE